MLHRFRWLIACAISGLLGTGLVSFATNYTMTQGAGTTFGSLVVGGVNYAQQFICDPTTVTQCAVVSAGGAFTVSVTGTAAVTQSGTWTVQPGNTANSTPWLATVN